MPKRSIEESMRRAEASNALEGLHATKEQDKLIAAALKGEITNEEFLEKVKRLANG